VIHRIDNVKSITNLIRFGASKKGLAGPFKKVAILIMIVYSVLRGET
jgi:hypothetical protein